MAYKTDADKIKRWREERHWSQEHLAELAGIGLRTVQRIENGEQASRDSLTALAAAFNVEAIALVIDPEVEASGIVQRRNVKVRAGARLVLWIHCAAYGLGLVLFTAICLAVGSFVMKWALIWWTVGLAAHAAIVVTIELITRYMDD
ncbi:helix-turn-helix domain-containing protein [Maricaulis salignorans]|uniref:Transcriptional regulator, contains XRE-family HTH domain n=1 Tax=Maricaulis salignorans TaxID=144026 RepID=A0A1G9UV50_9PROT|nr:helix-turn-helix transcriptional regulator [Maricaulis salignorans]SDM63710.1 Transcriptional regulator, contains XRE-family HTH domain [Maricaulis salignorans]